MKETKFLDRLQMIFRDVFGDENINITNKTNANDIENWDSFMHITLLAAVQDEFAVEFPMEEIIEIKNAGDMVQLLKEKLNGK
jgi:acyl carrier protein